MAEAHHSYERFEQGHHAASEEAGSHHGRNEAVKEVITGETHRAGASAQLESNALKVEINKSNSTLLKVLGTGAPAEEAAAAAAQAHEAKIVEELEPADARLEEEIAAHEHEVDHANTQHLDYELAEVGLQVGIVLASVSIIARRRWLLGAAGAAASAGVVLLLVGLLV
jgi:hypothetical protein